MATWADPVILMSRRWIRRTVVLLEPSSTTTRCPYKGVASYWSLRADDRYEPDVVWSHPEPYHDGAAVRGLLCFVDGRADVEVTDGRRA